MPCSSPNITCARHLRCNPWGQYGRLNECGPMSGANACTNCRPTGEAWRSSDRRPIEERRALPPLWGKRSLGGPAPVDAGRSAKTPTARPTIAYRTTDRAEAEDHHRPGRRFGDAGGGGWRKTAVIGVEVDLAALDQAAKHRRSGDAGGGGGLKPAVIGVEVDLAALDQAAKHRRSLDIVADRPRRFRCQHRPLPGSRKVQRCRVGKVPDHLFAEILRVAEEIIVERDCRAAHIDDDGAG